jgi:serine acetyltransferase
MESRRKTVPAGQRDQSAAPARTPFVGPGVTVDEGAIIEAGAVVLKDVKPWMIVSENTARD